MGVLPFLLYLWWTGAFISVDTQIQKNAEITTQKEFFPSSSAKEIFQELRGQSFLRVQKYFGNKCQTAWTSSPYSAQLFCPAVKGRLFLKFIDERLVSIEEIP